MHKSVHTQKYTARTEKLLNVDSIFEVLAKIDSMCYYFYRFSSTLEEHHVPATTTFEGDLLACQPSLRAFAISLSGNRDRADDLVQETLLRALANADSFQPGPDSSIQKWTFAILRNLYRSEYRKRRREVEDGDGSYAKTLKTPPTQVPHLEFEELRAAFNKLRQDQRDALLLVGVSGFSYEDAANRCGCAIGTIKSRVNRARKKLASLMPGSDGCQLEHLPAEHLVFASAA